MPLLAVAAVVEYSGSSSMAMKLFIPHGRKCCLVMRSVRRCRSLGWLVREGAKDGCCQSLLWLGDADRSSLMGIRGTSVTSHWSGREEIYSWSRWMDNGWEVCDAP